MRQIYIVNAEQIVTSESHPEGLYSVIRLKCSENWGLM